MQQQKCKDYELLMKEFISYKQQSLAEKEQMKRQIEKCRQQLERFTSKLDKRVDARINEEKLVTAHRIEEMEQSHSLEIQKMSTLLARKDSIIDEMRNLLRSVESQKRSLIQNNTKILVELSQGLENKGQKQNGGMDQGYKQLLKMYQFLIEENNDLKKEIYLLKRNGTVANNESFLIKQEKSLNQSDYKQKSFFENSKGDVTLNQKSVIKQKDKLKQKQKRPASSKLFKK